MTQDTSLPENIRQVAILIVGSRFNAAYELYGHTVLSESVLGNAKVEALVQGLRPVDLNTEEDCAYSITKALLQSGPLPAELYLHAVQTLGQNGASELVYLVGVYCLVSVTLNGFDVKQPPAP
ncbi:hypothetical protein DV736_g6453, partial [Chaetothyriales sp. CBS 134916]